LIVTKVSSNDERIDTERELGVSRDINVHIED